jgi:hypothetical protein
MLPEDAMKTYQIQFADGPFSTMLTLFFLTLLCLSVIGLPFGIAVLPTLYKVVERSDG